jgi:hypothetical protein
VKSVEKSKMYIHEPLSLVVTEEIGLEGLDGITLDGKKS